MKNIHNVEMIEVNRNDDYIFWQGSDSEGKAVYNITLHNSPKPTGGYYSRDWILARKNQMVDMFSLSGRLTVPPAFQKKTDYRLIQSSTFDIDEVNKLFNDGWVPVSQCANETRIFTILKKG